MENCKNKRALTDKEKNHLLESAQAKESLQEAIEHLCNYEKNNPEVDIESLYEVIKSSYRD